MNRKMYLVQQNVANWIDNNGREKAWLANSGEILKWDIKKKYYIIDQRENDKSEWYDSEHPKLNIILDILEQLLKQIDCTKNIAFIGDSTIDNHFIHEKETYSLSRRETSSLINSILSKRLNYTHLNIIYECVCGSGLNGENSIIDQFNRIKMYEYAYNIKFEIIICFAGWNSEQLTEDDVNKYTKQLFNLSLI
jgi:hypothetical protein